MAEEALAIFGGPSTFAAPVHVGRPNLGDRRTIAQYLEEILDRNWLTNGGPLVDEFETRVAALHGVKHCVSMTNGTIALEIAIRALGLRDEVIVPAFTFVATAHALQWQGITPVFCDVDKSHNIDPTRVEELITPRTTGILAVHLWGRPCDVWSLQHLADRHGLKLLFDAAHAFGAAHAGTMIGNFGDAEVLSFHATKVLNSFEGGAVLTNDAVLAERVRLMRNFGFSGVDNVIYVGTNGKMTEICAAMGLTSLASFPSFVARNRENYFLYRELLADVPGISLLDHGLRDLRTWHYVVLEVGDDCPLTRDELWRVLTAENVLARRYFTPGAHRMEPYRSYFPHAPLLVPYTEQLIHRVMTLPTGTATSLGDVGQIVSIMKRAIADAKSVRSQLERLLVEPDVSFPGGGSFRVT